MKPISNELNLKAALVGTLLLTIIVSTASFAYAGEQGKACKHGVAKEMYDHKPGRHMAKALSLTEAQQQTLKDQRESQAEARKQLREQTRAVEQALMAAVNAGASDSQLQTLADELGKLKAAAVLDRAKSHRAFLAVLTPEQKQQFEQLKQEHKGKEKSWREKHWKNRAEEMDS